MTEIANAANQEPWPSLETASWLSDRAGWVLAVSLLFGFAATVLIIWMGAVKEHHWDLLRENAQTEISKLNVQSEQLRADAEASKAEIAKANESAAEANLKAEEERLARIKIEARIGPRLLPQAEQIKLTDALKGFGAQVVTIQASPQLPESEWFARVLAAPLTSAGWEVTILPGDNSNNTIFPTGVIIRYATEWSAKNNGVPTKSPAAEKLAEFLRGLDISATALPQLDPPMQLPKTMKIIVSTK